MPPNLPYLIIRGHELSDIFIIYWKFDIRLMDLDEFN
jgi:hypothetical protein